MILTGKAREAFDKWKLEYKYFSSTEVLEFKYLSHIVQNAMIIEWLDTQLIFIQVKVYFELIGSEIEYAYKGSVTNETNHYFSCYNSRREAVVYAIEKANEIYNERNQ